MKRYYTLILAKRPRSDPEERYYADLRQMSGSQIPKRIRQKGKSTLPPQENVRGSQVNVQISNNKEDKAKVDKSIFRDLGFRPGTGWTHLPNTASGKRPRISGKCPDLKYQRG